MNKSQKHALEKSASLYQSKVITGWESLYSQKRKRIVEAFGSYFQGGSALELGVADGEMTQYLINHFSDYTIVDGSKQHLRQTKEKLFGLGIEEIETVHCLFEEYQPNRKFDAIIMAHILEHLEDPVTLLNRAKYWLADTGRFFIAVPNANSLHRHVGVKLGMLETCDSLNEQDRIVGHHRVYFPDLFRKHVQSAGLTIIKFGGLMIKPLSNRQIESQWSKELIDAFFALSEDFPELCSEIYIVAEVTK
jgi:2-polyprenyl-3-methyl-5-hydroxy-6-metoxy-1,4-benzoquinol methylase